MTSSSESDYSDVSENIFGDDQALDGMEDTISGYLFQPLVTPNVASLAVQDHSAIPEEPRSSFEDSSSW